MEPRPAPGRPSPAGSKIPCACILVWLINAVALLAVPYLIPSISVDSFTTALVAALVLGLINTIIRPILVILTLPATLLTLGLFIFVINGLLFWFVGDILRGFHVGGFWAGVFGSIVYSVISWLLSRHSPARRFVTASPNISFEFFPPRTPEGVDKLRAPCRKDWPRSRRSSTPSRSAPAARRAKARSPRSPRCMASRCAAAPHLSCIGASETRDAERARCTTATLGVRRLVALRGDLPSRHRALARGEFRFARELVEFVRRETGDWFHIEVAAYPEVHPQARSPAGRPAPTSRRKVAAGADSAITQYFYNADAYFRFVDDARAAAASTCRSCPASCRSRTTRSSPASRTSAAPRSRAGCG